MEEKEEEEEDEKDKKDEDEDETRTRRDEDEDEDEEDDDDAGILSISWSIRATKSESDTRPRRHLSQQLRRRRLQHRGRHITRRRPDLYAENVFKSEEYQSMVLNIPPDEIDYAVKLATTQTGRATRKGANTSSMRGDGSESESSATASAGEDEEEEYVESDYETDEGDYETDGSDSKGTLPASTSKRQKISDGESF